MAKAMKKNPRIIRVSVSNGMADSTATINSFRPLMLDIVFKGRRTLKVLKL
jgi:hypothetical protein